MSYLYSRYRAFLDHAQCTGKRVAVRLQDEPGETYFLTEVLDRSPWITIRYRPRRGGIFETWISELPSPVRHAGVLAWRAFDIDGESVTLIPDYEPAARSSHRTASLVGQVFGCLKVVEQLPSGRHGQQYRCVCECGGERITRASSLRAGHTISCGCMRGKNRIKPLVPGERFGLLTIVSEVPRPEDQTRNEIFYRVRCDCGNEVVRRRELIVRGAKPDCGCRGRFKLVGQRFGKVVVRDETRRTNRHRLYRADCDCGRTAWLRINDLRNGKARSCGCLRGQPPSSDDRDTPHDGG